MTAAWGESRKLPELSGPKAQGLRRFKENDMRELKENEINGVSGGWIWGAVLQTAKFLHKASQTPQAVERANQFEEMTGDNIYGGNGPKY